MKKLINDMNVLFVCMGNICRSPLAEALLKKKYSENNIPGEVSSAGFESFFINEPPDMRAMEIAQQNGLVLSGRARIFLKSDFDRFDKIYVMDTQNYRDVLDLARNENDKKKIDYMLNVLEPGKNRTMPDPLRTGVNDLGTVFSLLDRATDKIVEIAKAN
jgi:protein-tyrosine phosphatase